MNSEESLKKELKEFYLNLLSDIDYYINKYEKSLTIDITRKLLDIRYMAKDSLGRLK